MMATNKHTTRHNTSDTLSFFRSVMLLLCLLTAGMGSVWAQTAYYVFYNDTYGYLYNKNGTLATTKTIGANCVWMGAQSLVEIATEGKTFGPNPTKGSSGNHADNRALYSMVDANAYLDCKTGDSNAKPKIGSYNTSGDNCSLSWQIADGFLVSTARSTQTNILGYQLIYYVQTADGTAFSLLRRNHDTNNASSPINTAYDESKYFKATKAEVFTEERTISGDEVITQTGNYTYSTNATLAHQRVKLSDDTWFYLGDDGTAVDPSEEVTRSWELFNMDGYATIGTDGSISYTTPIPQEKRVALITCTITGSTTGRIAKVSKYVTFTNAEGIEDPVISFGSASTSDDALVSFSYPNATVGDKISFYYTTDGTDPTFSSTPYSAPFVVHNGTTIKVIAVKGGKTSGIVNSVFATVTINDYEDHTWTYYAGVDPEIDGGFYNDTYKPAGEGSKFDVRMYSPNPRNVKIAYWGTQGAQVSMEEKENTFIYYNTLEQSETPGVYHYQVISNPFSKRPSAVEGHDKVFYGFGGWKVTRGYEYMRHADGTAIGKDEVLALDEELYFTDLPYPSVNCTSAEIEMETTWVPANVQYGGENINSLAFVGGNYENNFLVLNNSCRATLSASYPVTIMQVEPDGSADYRSNIVYSKLVPTTDTKIEWANWQPAEMIDARGCNFTIGRGMLKTESVQDVTGTAVNVTRTNYGQRLKIESGKYKRFYGYDYALAAHTTYKQRVFFGNDYDRAKSDNDKLEFTQALFVTFEKDIKAKSGQEVCRVYSKSGRFITSRTVGKAEVEDCYYFGFSKQPDDEGYNYLEIQGGEWNNIAGAMGRSNNQTDPCTIIRMKGGRIKGSVYGGTEYTGSKGTRLLVFTGGEINGWIAGGANGTKSDGGAMTGSTYVYIGGNTRVDSNGSTTLINRSIGGNVFAAGCGWDSKSTAGKVSDGTNLVLADNAYVERGIYGGGGFGYTEATAHLYITGGHVAAKPGGVNNSAKYSADIAGGVFGGACQNRGGEVKIYMTGGRIDGSLYGGSNVSGDITGNTSINITGGEIIGNVYGGGNRGSVTGITTVELNGGSFGGNVFGGGEGFLNADGSVMASANVTGSTNVIVNGGEFAVRHTDTRDPRILTTFAERYNIYGGGNIASSVGETHVYVKKGMISNGSDGIGGFLDNDNDRGIAQAYNQEGQMYFSVFGGGYGKNTSVTGNTWVDFNIDGMKDITSSAIRKDLLDY